MEKPGVSFGVEGSMSDGEGGEICGCHSEICEGRWKVRDRFVGGWTGKMGHEDQEEMSSIKRLSSPTRTVEERGHPHIR